MKCAFPSFVFHQDFALIVLQKRYHLLHKTLRVVRVKNDKPVIVSLPLSWGRDDVETLTQFLFEVMNVPGLFVLKQPLAAVYGYGVTGGMVLDLGYDTIGNSSVVLLLFIFLCTVSYTLW